MINLFGYTKTPGHRVVRFALDQAIQQEMTTYLNTQVLDFELGCSEEIAFKGNYKPDAGEVLYIEEFDDLDNLVGAVTSPLNIPIADPDVVDFDSIKALFFGKPEGDGTVSIFLQSFDRRRVLSSAGFSIFHSHDVYKKIEGTGLILDTKVCAKLSGTRLLFFSFFHVRQMFDMSSYYKEATDADIQEFASLSQIHVPDLPALIALSDTWVRRKLWLVQQSQILEKVSSNDMKAIATEFQIAIVYEVVDGQDKIRLPLVKSELKTLLRFLDEDYYKSPLSQTHFISNSKRAAPLAAVVTVPATPL
jgi:Domain of unknown function (DUF4868)